jgi:hypothetical protein
MSTDDRPRLYWFAQYAPPSVLRRGRKDVLASPSDSLHMLRDGYAALYVSMLLKDIYDFGGILFNPPEIAYPQKKPLITIDSFGRGDLILMTTRPGLDQDLRSRRRPLHRSGTALEKTLLEDNIRKVFDRCSRGCVTLSEAVSSHIPNGQDRSYRTAIFHVHNDAFYISHGDTGNHKDLKRQDISEEATIGYMVYLPCLCADKSRNSPALLLVFGLNGTATLIWPHLLCRKYKKILQETAEAFETRLVMISFSPRFARSRLPATVKDIEVVDEKLLVDVRGF